MCYPVLSDIYPVYIKGLKKCFILPSTLCFIGGSPNHALYMLGCVEDEVIFLDPHTTQPASDINQTYHADKPGRINITQLDPSLSLCFLCRTEEEFDNLCIGVQEQLIEKSSTPLFEMVQERAPHMYGQQPAGPGTDSDPLDRKYDSEDEFEIL